MLGWLGVLLGLGEMGSMIDHLLELVFFFDEEGRDTVGDLSLFAKAVEEMACEHSLGVVARALGSLLLHHYISSIGNMMNE